MDELGDKLSAILNDPESMERVKQMAQSLLGGEDGGTAVQSQQVEEDSFVTAPAESSRIGYTFARWNYDFSQAITQDTEIKAVWSAHTDTKYRVEYYWENVENDEKILEFR